MASKVSNLLRIYGRHDYGPGEHMYHANDGVRDGGVLRKKDRHSVKKALHKLRMRATGMSDQYWGSKEVEGALDNRYEQKPKR